MELAFLYRGPLSSCNYACNYCPFAKHRESRAEHLTDQKALERFVDWVAERTSDKLSVFFTPWGEALIRPRYQKALIRLTNLPHLAKVAIQTNLSGKLDWVAACDKSRLAIWATYHPSQTTIAKFLAKCEILEQAGVRYSVGVVGLRENASEIQALRHALPPHVYLWINAYKNGAADYYSPELLELFTEIDPLFPLNRKQHFSRGQACRTGETVIAVDGDGIIQRCHFVKKTLGNIYEAGFEEILKPRPCPKLSCNCYIGYAHLEELELNKVFGDGILERIPQEMFWLQQVPN